MKSKVKDDKTSLLGNEERDTTLSESLSPMQSRKRLTWKYYINEVFDSTIAIQNPNNGTLFHRNVDINQFINDAAARVCEDIAKLKISAISGITVAYVSANEVDDHCYRSSSKRLNDHLSNGSKRKRSTDKKRQRNKTGQKNIVHVKERVLSCSDHSRAFYSAIYIDANLTMPHFGDI